MLLHFLAAALVGLVAFCAATAQTLPPLTDFRAGAVVVAGHSYPYRVLEPLAHQRGQPLPLVVFLHGAGERGDDNAQQLRWLPEVMVAPAVRLQFPCYLLAVQCPQDEQWVDAAFGDRGSHRTANAPTRAMQAVLAAVAIESQCVHVDPARVYLTGLSMGGFGAFDLAARQPERFAGVVAICGGGDPSSAPRLCGLPVQVWHGSTDGAVPVERSRAMVAALRAAFAAVDYRELAGVGHDAWRQAYGDGGALPWLFAQDQRQQQRGTWAQPPLVPAVDLVQLTGGTFTLKPGARCLAAGDARDAAAALVGALSAPASLQPGLVQASEVRSGDIVFVIDPTASAAFVVRVTDHVLVTARDQRALHRGAAAAAQALRTLPDWSCPCGTFVMHRIATGNRVMLPVTAKQWSMRTLTSLLRTCWWFGVDQLGLGDGVRTVDANEADRQLLRELERYGIEWVAVGDALPASTLRWEGDAEAILRHAVTTPPCAFAVLVSDEDDALSVLRVRLAVAVERAHRTGTLHLGSLRSRLGQLHR